VSFFHNLKRLFHDSLACLLTHVTVGEFYDVEDLLRWVNTVFDTCVSFTLFSKTLDPSVIKNGSKQVNNTNFCFLMVKLTYVPFPWQHEQI